MTKTNKNYPYASSYEYYCNTVLAEEDCQEKGLRMNLRLAESRYKDEQTDEAVDIVLDLWAEIHKNGCDAEAEYLLMPLHDLCEAIAEEDLDDETREKLDEALEQQSDLLFGYAK